ncbi:hypothetical protein CVT26_001104 [Gymnopilus dilepis]|uniref:MARVEL domain-containing protein n=1 Tax=Gymnopilus dilepis TaxID=231916 RepID=A0A409W7G1_9AGAR|nr:hypothetical protein CVT26_001104 [Gymnopilus dilepis]
MAESRPLLQDIDDENPQLTSGNGQPTSPSLYFRPLLRILSIVVFVLSILTLGLLIANIVIIGNAPFTYSPWWTQEKSKALISVIVPVIVFSVINIFVKLPVLLNIIVDIFLAAFTIAHTVSFIDAFPSQSWCQERIRYPGPGRDPPHPKCEHWKFISTILMSITAGLSILIALRHDSAAYLLQLLLRSLAIYRTQSWKIPLSLAFPTGEITFQVTLKVLRQERNEGAEGTSHGPVHL